MRRSLLIAVREYAENARTKGFWIGLLLFPMLLFMGVRAPAILAERATPTRYFLMLDGSGQFSGLLDEALERYQTRQLLKSLTQYALKYSAAAAKAAEKSGSGPTALDLEHMPVPAAQTDALDHFLESYSDANPQALDRFMQSGGEKAFLDRVKPQLKPNAPPFQGLRVRFRRVPFPDGVSTHQSFPELVEALRPWLRGERKVRVEGSEVTVHALVLIPTNVLQRVIRPGDLGTLNPRARAVEYWSENLGDVALREEVERTVNGEVRRREYAARGIDTQAVRAVERTYVPVSSLNPRKSAGSEDVSMADYIRQYAPSAFVYLLWVAIFSIAQMLLNNTIEEKSNKIIEVLLSSVTPGELMAGKLVGIAGLGLTMVGAWLLALFGVLLGTTGQGAEFAREALKVLQHSNLLPAFGFYFLSGYFMYAGIILALGSVCNTLKEAQNFMAVIVLLMMVPLLTLPIIPKDPNGTLATVLSWIPLYTPFVMMNRATAHPPLFDVAGTVLLMLASATVSIVLSARVFRMGVLRTGQPPRILELLRWLRRDRPE